MERDSALTGRGAARRSMGTRREFLRGVGGTIASMAGAGLPISAACGASRGADGTLSTGGHIVEGSFSDVARLNPVLVGDASSQLVTSLMFDGLLGLGPAGGLVPLVANSLPEVSPDQTTLTFRIRDGVTFSDGRPLTSEDVAFTYDLMFSPAYRAVRSPRRGDFEQHLESITTPDRSTVVFKTKGVWAPFLARHGRYGILPKHILGSLPADTLNTADFNDAPSVVNGVMKFVRWDKGQQVVLTRNERYHGGRSRLDRYIYKVVADSATLVEQLKTGEVDFGSVDPAFWSDLANSRTVDRLPPFSVPSVTFYAYQTDPSKPAGRLFSERAVRQALVYALDRQKIVDRVYYGLATVADSVEPPTSWAHVQARPVYEFDRRKAEAMLDAAGWVKGAGGIRAKNGVSLRFEMLTSQGNGSRAALLEVMQQAWRDVGVDATPRLVSAQQLGLQLTDRRSFDMVLLGFSFTPDPDESALWATSATAPGGFNGLHFSNREADGMLADAVATLDQGSRKTIYARFQDLMNHEAPAPVVVFEKGLWAVNKRVRGLQIGAFNAYDGRYLMRDTWVSDRR